MDLKCFGLMGKSNVSHFIHTNQIFVGVEIILHISLTTADKL